MLTLWTRSGNTRPEIEARFLAAVPTRVTYSIRDKGRELIRRLRSGPLAMTDLYIGCRSGSELVATFVAVLELCRSGNLLLSRQEGELTVACVGDEQELEAILESFEEES